MRHVNKRIEGKRWIGFGDTKNEACTQNLVAHLMRGLSDRDKLRMASQHLVVWLNWYGAHRRNKDSFQEEQIWEEKILSSMLACWSRWKFLETSRYLGLKFSKRTRLEISFWETARDGWSPKARELSGSLEKNPGKDRAPEHTSAEAKGGEKGASKEHWERVWRKGGRRENWGEGSGKRHFQETGNGLPGQMLGEVR